MQGNFKYPRIKKIHQDLEKIRQFYHKAKILCLLKSHELLSTKIYYTSIYICYIWFTFKQVQEFKNYQNTSSTSKVTSKTILIILLSLFSICNTYEFQV